MRNPPCFCGLYTPAMIGMVTGRRIGSRNKGAYTAKFYLFWDALMTIQKQKRHRIPTKKSYTLMILSILIKFILRIKGAKIGQSFTCEGFPKITGNSSNISIGDNVRIMKNVEFKIRDDSVIIINNHVKIDDGVRIISANNSTLTIDDYSKVMFHSMINAGADIKIGKKSGISAFCIVNSSLHQFNKGKNYMDQCYDHKPILIGNDVQVGSHSYIMPGVTIGNGAIISTHSVVKSEVKGNMIVAGIPARVVDERE